MAKDGYGTKASTVVDKTKEQVGRDGKSLEMGSFSLGMKFAFVV